MAKRTTTPKEPKTVKAPATEKPLKVPSKKKRTFGQVEFIYADGVEGRFVGFLPPLTEAEGKLH